MIVTGSDRHMPRLLSAALVAPLALLLAGYRRWVSPVLPPACRFHPTCSEYASDAIAAHGPFRGLALAARRLARCHPWCEGGMDPVPPSDRGVVGRAHPAVKEPA
jgi:putative membrane protein insertion efficiency factor